MRRKRPRLLSQRLQRLREKSRKPAAVNLPSGQEPTHNKTKKRFIKVPHSIKFSPSNKMNATESFNVTTALPEPVIILSCIYMASVFAFSVPANIGIFVLFFKSPMVSLHFSKVK